MDILTATLISALRGELVVDQSLENQSHTHSRPDLQAWTILALQAAGAGAEELHPLRNRLIANQWPDGRVSLGSDHPTAFWPTPLAVLAWNQTPEFQEAQLRAITFLLNATGYHFPRPSGGIIGHDSTLKGWPWIEETHSWVIPTSLTVIALKGAGWGDHVRVVEAKRLLLDRQLPDGGWNYGNTSVFGQKLHPMPESTGMALNALADIATSNEVAPSLTYLRNRISRIRTPLSLSWGLMGLEAWGEKLPKKVELLHECWQRQQLYGTYDASAISQMLLALTTSKGIHPFCTRFTPEYGKELPPEVG